MGLSWLLSRQEPHSQLATAACTCVRWAPSFDSWALLCPRYNLIHPFISQHANELQNPRVTWSGKESKMKPGIS